MEATVLHGEEVHRGEEHCTQVLPPLQFAGLSRQLLAEAKVSSNSKRLSSFLFAEAAPS